MNLIRHLLSIALVLVLVVTLSSAFIRLSQSGPPCPDWPACYGAKAEVPAPASSEGPAYFARALHRIAASVAGILFLIIAVLGWRRWRNDSRRTAAVALVVLAGLLAGLGRYTPSTLPAVMLGNLLGGMALLGLLAWLRQCTAGGETPTARARVRIALSLAALPIVLGVVMVFVDFPVALALAHNAVAFLVLIVLAGMLPRPGPKESLR